MGKLMCKNLISGVISHWGCIIVRRTSSFTDLIVVAQGPQGRDSNQGPT